MLIQNECFNVEFGESIGHKFRIPIFSQYSLRTAVGAWMDLQVRFKTKTCRNAWLQNGEKGEILIVPSPFGNRNVDMSNGWMRTGSHFIKVDNATAGPKGINQRMRFPVSQNHLLSLNFLAFSQVLDRKRCHQWWNNHGRPYVFWLFCACPFKLSLLAAQDHENMISLMVLT